MKKVIAAGGRTQGVGSKRKTPSSPTSKKGAPKSVPKYKRQRQQLSVSLGSILETLQERASALSKKISKGGVEKKIFEDWKALNDPRNTVENEVYLYSEMIVNCQSHLRLLGSSKPRLKDLQIAYILELVVGKLKKCIYSNKNDKDGKKIESFIENHLGPAKDIFESVPLGMKLRNTRNKVVFNEKDYDKFYKKVRSTQLTLGMREISKETQEFKDRLYEITSYLSQHSKEITVNHLFQAMLLLRARLVEYDYKKDLSDVSGLLQSLLKLAGLEQYPSNQTPQAFVEDEKNEALIHGLFGGYYCFNHFNTVSQLASFSRFFLKFTGEVGRLSLDINSDISIQILETINAEFFQTIQEQNNKNLSEYLSRLVPDLHRSQKYKDCLMTTLQELYPNLL